MSSVLTIHDLLNRLLGLSGLVYDLLDLLAFTRRRGPRGDDDLDPAVLASAFCRLVAGNGFGGGIPDGLDSVGTQSTVDEGLAGMLGPCTREFEIVAKRSPIITPNRNAVGMSGDFYALVTELLEGGSNSLQQRRSCRRHGGISQSEQLAGRQGEGQLVASLSQRHRPLFELVLEGIHQILADFTELAWSGLAGHRTFSSGKLSAILRQAPPKTREQLPGLRELCVSIE